MQTLYSTMNVTRFSFKFSADRAVRILGDTKTWSIEWIRASGDTTFETSYVCKDACKKTKTFKAIHHIIRINV